MEMQYNNVINYTYACVCPGYSFDYTEAAFPQHPMQLVTGPQLTTTPFK